MGIFISLEIVFLAMLTYCLFQLPAGIFSIFYHYASGKSSSRKADGLSIYYILGVELFLSVIFLLLYLIFSYLFINIGPFTSTIFPWVLVGIFLALSIASFFFYFRKGAGTELFISRKLANRISANAKNVKTSSDALVLGFTASIPELIFTFPLFAATAIVLANTTEVPRPLFVLLYIVIAISPLFFYHHLFHTGHNLAEIQRSRVKNKTFYRIAICIGFLLLALTMFNLGFYYG